MATPKPVVQVLAPPAADVTDVTGPLAAGFDVRVQQTPPTDPPAAVTLVVVESHPDLAAAATRRLKADAPTGPVLWLLTADTLSAARDGFDAGADACFVRPADPDLLVAQVTALVRTRERFDRLTARGTDVRDLSGRLEERFRRTDGDAGLARAATAAFLPQSPATLGPLTAAWVHRPAPRGVSTLFDVIPGPDGRLRLLLAGVGGLGATGGAAVLGFLGRWLTRELLTTTPAAALTSANRRLRELTLPDAAVVSAIVGTVDADAGTLTVACGGLPAPLLLPADGPVTALHGSGPFLAATAGPYFDLTGELGPGGKLVLFAGLPGTDVRAAGETHRGLTAEAFVAAVAAGLHPDPDDGFTLLAVGRAGDRACEPERLGPPAQGEERGDDALGTLSQGVTRSARSTLGWGNDPVGVEDASGAEARADQLDARLRDRGLDPDAG